MSESKPNHYFCGTSLCNRYCQKLPSDRYTFLAPLFDVTKLPDREIRVVEVSSCQTEQLRMEFSCSLQLPMNCPVKADIQVCVCVCVVCMCVCKCVCLSVCVVY